MDTVEVSENGEFTIDGMNFGFTTKPEIILSIKKDPRLHPSDVLIACFPKSGTTWLEEMLYTITEGLEVSAKRTQRMDTLILYLEASHPGMPSAYDLLPTTPPPRLLKTHLHAYYFERYLAGEPQDCPKFVHITRNPKDVLVSLYQFLKKIPLSNFAEMSWVDFFESFKMRRVLMGDVFDHILTWWKYRNHPRVLMLRYEEMLADSSSAIRQLSAFLERPLSTEEVEAVAHHASFQSMKSRGRASYFSSDEMWDDSQGSIFRKAQRGDWKNYFTEDQNRYIDEIIKERCEPLGIEFLF